MNQINLCFESPLYHGVHGIFFKPSFQQINCEEIGSIVYSSPELTFIENAISSCREWINKKYSKFQLTPLHLSVIRPCPHPEVISKLVQSEASVDSTDFKGFTPLMHAAIVGDQALIARLLQEKANPKVKNELDGTFEDYKRMVKPFIQQDDNIQDFVAQSSFIPDCLGSNTTFIEHNVARPSVLAQIWNQPKAENLNVKNCLKKMIRDLKNQFEKQSGHAASAYIHRLENGRCGAVAAKLIKKGEPIGLYTGEVTLSQPDDVEYYFSPIDGKYYRGVLAMSNDGFPNSDALFIRPLKGLEEQALMFATEDIQPGEEIVWNYGSGHHVKWKGHEEPRRQDLLDYFRLHSFEEIFESTKLLLNDRIPQNKIWDCYDQFIKLQYILKTPSSFIGLIEEKIIDNSKIETLLRMILTEPSLHETSIVYPLYVFSILVSLLDKIKENHPNPNITNEILSLFKEAIFSNFGNALDQMHTGLATILQTIKDVPQEMLKQDDKLKAYLRKGLKKKIFWNRQKALDYLNSNFQKFYRDFV